MEFCIQYQILQQTHGMHGSPIILLSVFEQRIKNVLPALRGAAQTDIINILSGMSGHTGSCFRALNKIGWLLASLPVHLPPTSSNKKQDEQTRDEDIMMVSPNITLACQTSIPPVLLKRLVQDCLGFVFRLELSHSSTLYYLYVFVQLFKIFICRLFCKF